MAIMTKQVVAGDHDAAESGGTVDVSGGALNANASSQYIGLLFVDCSELAGATINSAHLECYFVSGSFDDPYVYIKFHRYGGIRTAWVGSASEISSQTKISGSVTWDASSLGIGWENSPDFTSLLQDLIDSGDFPYFGYYNIAAEISGIDGTSLCRIRAYEGDSAQAAKLVVDYTPAAAGQPTVARARQVPGMRRPHGHQGW